MGGESTVIAVVPMAGRGTRMGDYDANTPKPLINVAGQPMIVWALESLRGMNITQIIFIALAEHETGWGVKKIVTELVGYQAEVILLDEITEGQLCTVLAARDLLKTDEDLLVASSDTYVVSDLNADITRYKSDCHGLISVAQMPGERWSFARIDESGWVVEVAEKKRISDYASTGMYYFTSGHEFVSVADEIIRNRDKTYGEYYVIQVYEEYIESGMRVGMSIASEMWDMGDPIALKRFESHLEAQSQ